jgi:hypothetical protein
VALTIPCVTGPYTGINATLSQGSAIVRVQAPGAGYQPWNFVAPPTGQQVVGSPVAAVGTSTIVTSSGQNDAGLFEVNFRDERWLPFEGRGAVSTWNLLTSILFPYSNLGSGVKISSFAFLVPLSVPAAGDAIAATFGVTNVASPAALSLAPSSLAVGDNTPVNALTGTAQLTTQLAAPQSFDLTVPSASVPAALATTGGGVTRLDPSKVEDILLIINYSID